MKLPNFKRIFRQDYDEQYQSMIETLASSINIGFETLYSALNNNLSLKDNLYCSLVTLQVKTDANGIPVPATNFTIDSFLKTVSGLEVINALNLTNSAGYPIGGVFLSATQTQSGFVVNKVTGLVPGDLYQLKIIVWG